MALVYHALSQPDKSLPLFEELLRLQTAARGRQHPDTLKTMDKYGVALVSAGRFPEAIAVLNEGFRLAKMQPQRLLDLGRNLLSCHMKAGRPADAAALTRELESVARATLPADGTQLAEHLAWFGYARLEAGDHAEAERFLRECLTTRERLEPELWNTFNSRSLLGGALLGQKKYADAEPLLVKGYEGMKAREKTIPQGSTRIPEALDRLIEFYTATGKPDEVKKWRAERAKYPTRTPVAPPPREKK